MKLAALLGYDVPAKLWIDGSERFHDPTGTNPAIPDARAVLFDAAGEHELVIALGTNHGRAWGIFLRFERRDVSASQLRKLLSVAMPELIG